MAVTSEPSDKPDQPDAGPPVPTPEGTDVQQADDERPQPRLSWLQRRMSPRHAVGIYITEGQATMVKLSRQGETIQLVAATVAPVSQVDAELPRMSAGQRTIVGLEDDGANFRMGLYPPMPRSELTTVLARDARTICADSDDICWDYAPVGAGPDGVQQRVLLAAAPALLVARCRQALGGSKVSPCGIGAHRLAHLAVLNGQFGDDVVCALIDVHPAYLTVDICEPGRGPSPWPWAAVSRTVPLSSEGRPDDATDRIVAELQRSMVYYRQLTHGRRVNCAVIAGPAAVAERLVPGLAAQLTVPVVALDIAAAVEVKVALEAGSDRGWGSGPDWSVPVGLALQAMAGTTFAIDLLPEPVRNARRYRLRAAAIGIAALLGVGLISGSAAAMRYAASCYDRSASQSRRQVQRALPLLAQRKAMKERRCALVEHLELIAKLDRPAPWQKMLSRIAAAVAPDVVLVSMSIQVDGDVGRLSLRGRVPGTDPAASLARELRRLRAVAFITEVKLMPIEARGSEKDGTMTCWICCQLDMRRIGAAAK